MRNKHNFKLEDKCTRVCNIRWQDTSETVLDWITMIFLEMSAALTAGQRSDAEINGFPAHVGVTSTHRDIGDSFDMNIRSNETNISLREVPLYFPN